MTYGQAMPTLSYTFQGFVNGDTHTTAVKGAPVLSAQAAQKKTMPGAVTITAAMGSLSAANYSFVFGTGTLTIGKAMLTVTPKATVISYGGQVPSLGFDLAGFVNGDTAAVVSGTPVLTTATTSASPAGQYTITASIGTLASDLYSFKLMSGGLTVAKAVLTVTADSITSTYGSALPTLTYTVSGLVNGDTATAAINGLPQMTSTGGSTSSAGQYSITPAQGTLVAANYSFRFKSGILSIAKAPLTVMADNLSMQAGSAIPTLTYTVSGLANGDTASSATSGTPALATTAAGTSPVGSYPVSITHGTMTAANYTLTFVNGTLTVTQKSTGSGDKGIIVPRVPPIRVTPHTGR